MLSDPKKEHQSLKKVLLVLVEICQNTSECPALKEPTMSCGPLPVQRWNNDPHDPHSASVALIQNDEVQQRRNNVKFQSSFIIRIQCRTLRDGKWRKQVYSSAAESSVSSRSTLK